MTQKITEKQPSRSGRTPRFSKDVIARTAMTMIDRDGFQAFSMRSLAAELGIAVMTLYVYFPNREEILAAIGKLLLGKLGSSVEPSATWDVRVEGVVRDLYEVMQAHPGAIDIFISELSSLPASDRVTDYVRETLLGILLANGFSVQDTTNIVSALIDFVIGHAIVQRNYEFRMRNAKSASKSSAAARKKYPNIVKVAAKYTSRSSRTTFEFGLDILLVGLRDRYDAG